MKKLHTTTGVLAAVAASALLSGLAFASDAMRTSDTSAGRSPIAVLARSTDAKGEAKGDLISAAARAMNDRVDVDKDKDQDVDKDVDKDKDQDVDKDNDEAEENDVDNDADDQPKADTDNDDHGKAVSAVASTNRHGDKHSDRGR